MDLKPRLQRQLEGARKMSEALLASFETPEQWTHQLFPGANHAMWFAGHIATADNFFIGLLAPSKGQEKAGYNEKFGGKSTPTSKPADYPPASEVLAYMRERRQALLDVLTGMSEQDLAVPVTGAPEFLTDKGSVFEAAIWHEGLHSGQVSLIRRSLGKPPVFG